MFQLDMVDGMFTNMFKLFSTIKRETVFFSKSSKAGHLRIDNASALELSFKIPSYVWVQAKEIKIKEITTEASTKIKTILANPWNCIPLLPVLFSKSVIYFMCEYRSDHWRGKSNRRAGFKFCSNLFRSLRTNTIGQG